MNVDVALLFFLHIGYGGLAVLGVRALLHDARLRPRPASPSSTGLRGPRG